MNFSCNNKISNNQLLAVIVAAFLGCTAVSAPLGIIETAGGGACISVFLGGFAASIFFYILVRLTGKRITDSYQNVVYNSLGKFLGFLVLAAIFVYTSVYGGFQLSTTARMVHFTMEKSVSSLFAAILIVFVAFYTALRGRECVGRISEIAAVLMLAFIVFIFVISAPPMDLITLRPTPDEWRGILKGAFMSFSALSVAGYVFVMLPNGGNTKKTAFSVFLAFLIITVVLSFGTALAVSCFGVEESKRKLWPVIQMMNYTEFPGSLVERQEVLMSGFYVFSSFILTSLSVHISSVVLESIFKSINRVFSVLAACAVVLFFCLCALRKGGFEAVYSVYGFNLAMYGVMLLAPIASLLRRKK